MELIEQIELDSGSKAIDSNKLNSCLIMELKELETEEQEPTVEVDVAGGGAMRGVVIGGGCGCLIGGGARARGRERS